MTATLRGRRFAEFPATRIIGHGSICGLAFERPQPREAPQRTTKRQGQFVAVWQLGLVEPLIGRLSRQALLAQMKTFKSSPHTGQQPPKRGPPTCAATGRAPWLGGAGERTLTTDDARALRRRISVEIWPPCATLQFQAPRRECDPYVFRNCVFKPPPGPGPAAMDWADLFERLSGERDGKLKKPTSRWRCGKTPPERIVVKRDRGIVRRL